MFKSLARRRKLLRLALAGPALYLAVPHPAQSRSWPEKPIKLVLGYPAGGGADGVARQLQSKLEALLGQRLIFDYKAGATGTIAADFVTRAVPDGYTLHFAESGALTILPNARKLNYDPLSSFTPIGLVAGGAVVLVAHPSLPVNNVTQLISLLKQKPGGLAFGTAGIATFGHLAGELFLEMSQTEMTHVPYKGGAPAIVDLIGGQVPLLFASIGTALPQIESGKMKALGVTSAMRTAALPSVPTIAEQGISGYEVTMWFALLGPSKLPAEVALRLSSVMTEALADSTVQAGIKRQGYEPTPSTPRQLLERMQTDFAKWGKLIRSRKLNLE